MKQIKKWKKAAAAFLLGGTLLLGANQAGAEPVQQDGMWAFKEAYLAVKDDNRPFLESISFFGPTFHADLDFQGQVLRDASMRLAGRLSWGFTERGTGSTTQMDIPFYLVTEKKDLVLYAQQGENWYKLSLPGVPAAIADDIKTTDIQELQENMETVKSVNLLQDNEKQRCMNIVLDGGKVAAQVVKYNKPDAKMTPAEQQKQQEFIQRLSKTLKGIDIPVTWTVDKVNWRTITVGLDLTDAMRAYAREVLQEAADGKIQLKDQERGLLDALGYYSELHSYTTYLGVDKAKNLDVPKDVRKSAQSLNIFKPMEEEVAASAEKK